MPRHRLLIGIAALGVAACTSGRMTPAERSVQEQAVRDRTTGWLKAFNNRSTSELAGFYLQAPDLVVAWPDGRRTNGWDAESQAERDYFQAIRTINLVAQDVQVHVLSPSVALVTFRHSTDEIRGTDRDLFTGQGMMVWVREDAKSEWVIQAQQMSRNAVAVSAPSVRR